MEGYHEREGLNSYSNWQPKGGLPRPLAQFSNKAHEIFIQLFDFEATETVPLR